MPLYVDELVLHGKSKEDLWAMMGCFFEVYRRGLKVHADKNKLNVMNGEEGLKSKVHMYGMQIVVVSEFKYLGSVLDESSSDDAVVVGMGKFCVCLILYEYEYESYGTTRRNYHFLSFS